MKIYVSADIEGVTGITSWAEVRMENAEYRPFQEQMTREVTAACRGALKAGATEIVVKDAHASGRNILAAQLPLQARLIRGWSGHPLLMVQELDASFSALMMIGYHAPAGGRGNPLGHTMSSRKIHKMRLNGMLASEFLLHTFAAYDLGVPVILVSGDEELCEHVKNFNQEIHTVCVSRGIGASTLSMHPREIEEKILLTAEMALNNVNQYKIPSLPKVFILDMEFKEHMDAYKAGFYPGAERKDAHTITIESSQYLDILRAILFLV